jgi:hypothetical protein
MMARRPAFNVPPEPTPPAAPPVERPIEQPAIPTQAPRRAAARQGKIQVAFFVDPDAKLQLDIIAARERQPLQRLMLEALDMLFQARGQARIAVAGAGREAAE